MVTNTTAFCILNTVEGGSINTLTHLMLHSFFY